MKGTLRRLLAIFLVMMLMSADICAIAEGVATLTLPSALQIIDEEAFAGNISIEKVIVPDGTTEIRSRAFGDSSMTELVLPDSLTFIAEDAFEGCGEFTLSVPENCYAYDRCVELCLIKQGEPDPSVIESAHPYADDFDYTWIHDEGDGTESVTITFSTDTETEDGYDFIYIYTLNDVMVGQYSGTELAGQSVTVDGTGFKLRLISDKAWDGSNTYYGFRLDSIVSKKAVPLVLESITAESDTITAGETIRWTVTTTGGKNPIYYDYVVLRSEEKVASGTVEAPNAIEYTPVQVGEYKLSVSVRDSGANVLPKQVSESVTAAPSTVYPESPHLYPPRCEDSWFYAAEENVQSLAITFSEETKLEDRDRIHLYDQDGILLQTYSGTQLAGKTIEIMGNAFSISPTNGDALVDYGFSITNIEKYIPGPLSFISLTADKSKAKVGDLVSWTMETEGGKLPVTYEYTVMLNGETKYTGSATRPDKITYIPTEAGDYTVSVVTKDAEGNVLDPQTSLVRIAARDATPEADFSYTVLNGLQARITGYTGEENNVVVPVTVDGYQVAEIGESAFRNHPTLVTVSLPATVTKIVEYAFANCDALQGVRMEEGLISIGGRAFEDCDTLRSIVFPDSVTTFGNRVLRHNDELAFVHFPTG